MLHRLNVGAEAEVFAQRIIEFLQKAPNKLVQLTQVMLSPGVAVQTSRQVEEVEPHSILVRGEIGSE